MPYAHGRLRTRESTVWCFQPPLASGLVWLGTGPRRGPSRPGYPGSPDGRSASLTFSTRAAPFSPCTLAPLPPYQLYHSSVTHIHSYVHKTKATPWGVAITFLGLPDVYLAIQSIHPSTSDRSGCNNDVILTQPMGQGSVTGARGPPGMRAIATRAPSQAITD